MFFKKLHEDAVLPTVGTNKSVGHDLYVYDDEVVVPALETAVIHTGVRFSEEFNKGDINEWYGIKSPVYVPGRVGLSAGLSLAMFGKIEIKIEPRSGLAAKHDLDVINVIDDRETDMTQAVQDALDGKINLQKMAGICDQDYTGEIMVLIHNLHPTKEFTFEKGDKCAQMIFNVGLVDLDCVQDVERAGGFGSTGS